jgi:hypothetical protein
MNYITDKNKAERIVTHGLDESRSLAQQFIDTAMLHGKGDTYDERKYYHIKISFEPKDRIENGGKLNGELAEKIASEYFVKQYGHHEFVLATHTDKEHIHCHAIINAVSFESGKKIQHSNTDLADMKDHVNDVAEKYGVSRFDWKQAVKKKREKAKEGITTEPKELTQSEKYIQDRHGGEWSTSSWKETLRNKIDEAKEKCTSRTEFAKYLLENYGIEMPRNTNKTVSFKHPAVDETVRGVKLGSEYTAESIDKILKRNSERNTNHAELRFTKERTADSGAEPIGGDNTGTDNEIIVGHNISANGAVGSRADESGERGTETNTGELREKLQQIRGLDKRFNPTEQRKSDEAAERAAHKTRAEAERIKNEQRGGKQKRRGHDRGDER